MREILLTLIVTLAPEYQVNPKVATAIIAQESGFRNINTYNSDLSILDIGPAQINNRTAKHYGLNLYLLQTDMRYHIESFLTILRDKKRTCNRLPSLQVTNELPAWSCYHSFNEDKREIYAKLVGRYL